MPRQSVRSRERSEAISTDITLDVVVVPEDPLVHVEYESKQVATGLIGVLNTPEEQREFFEASALSKGHHKGVSQRNSERGYLRSYYVLKDGEYYFVEDEYDYMGEFLSQTVLDIGRKLPNVMRKKKKKNKII